MALPPLGLIVILLFAAACIAAVVAINVNAYRVKKALTPEQRAKIEEKADEELRIW